MTTKPLNLLILQDAAHDAESIKEQFKQAGYDVHCELVANKTALKSALKQAHWDAVVSGSPRQAEDLRVMDGQHRSLFEHMLNGFAYCRMIFEKGQPQDFVYLAVNNAFESLTGLKNVVGKNVSEVIPGIRKADPLLFEAYGRVAQSGVPEKIEVYVEALQNWFSIALYSPMQDHFVAVFDVITERKQAEVALWESRAKLEAALASMTDAVFISDATGHFVEFNDAFATFHRFASKAECADALSDYPDIIEVFYPNGELAPLEMWAVSRALRGETATNAEYTLRRKDSGETWVGSYSFSPIRDKAGLIVGSVVVGRDITEIKQAEAVIMENEERFRAMFEMASIGMGQADPKTGRFLRTNKKMRQITGFTEDELLKMRVSDLTYSEDREKDWEAFQEVVSGRTPDYRIEKRYVRKDGAIVWVNVNMTLIRDAFGKPLHTMATIEDITERKQGEEAIRASDERFRTLFDLAPDAIYLHDLNGVFIDGNQAAEALVGDTREELIGKSFLTLNILSQEDQRRAVESLGRNAQGEPTGPAEYLLSRKDGRQVSVEIRSFPIRIQGRPLVLGVAHDITARKASELQLRQLSRAVEQSPTAIVITDTQGAIQYINPKFTAITGYSFEEALGKSPSILKSGETPLETYKDLWDTIKSGREWRGEFHNKKKNGELFWESASISPITDKNGVITNFLAVKEDITEHKALTEQFLRAQRLENIGTLASGIAHDLNNILAPIMMAASMLEDDLPKDTHHKLVSAIYEAAQRGSDIVKQVLTFARGVEGNRTTLRPELLVAQVGRILRETFPKAIAFTESMPEGLWEVSGDATQLHQVLLNLCVNARDSMMPDGGTLTITAANIEIDENYAATSLDAKPGRYVVIKVIDSGCGMPPKIIHKIFDPFFTTKEAGQGTGLGLSTVVGIVKSHKGFLEVDSELGRGSVFRVFIPAERDRQNEADPVKICTSAPKGNGETILLVDDEAEILKVASVTLTQNGYVVLLAADGIEALTTYVKHSEAIKVVVTDVMMPMMDGVNLTRALKRISPQVRVIAASGHAEESHHNELRAMGIQAFLGKPFNIYQLLEAVHNTINRPAN